MIIEEDIDIVNNENLEELKELFEIKQNDYLLLSLHFLSSYSLFTFSLIRLSFLSLSSCCPFSLSLFTFIYETTKHCLKKKKISHE